MNNTSEIVFEEIWIIGVVHFLFFLSFTKCKMQGRNPKSFITHYVRKLLLHFWKLRIQNTHNLLFLTAFFKNTHHHMVLKEVYLCLTISDGHSTS